MKYRDNNFIKYKNNERDLTNRSIKRERELKYSNFYKKYLINNIDICWWDCLNESDKQEIISIHNNINLKLGEYYWTSIIILNSYEQFLIYIKDNFEPNKKLLRNKRLQKLGI